MAPVACPRSAWTPMGGASIPPVRSLEVDEEATLGVVAEAWGASIPKDGTAASKKSKTMLS